MKTNTRMGLLWVVLVMLALPAVAKTNYQAPCYYTVANDTVTITKYTGPGGDPFHVRKCIELVGHH